MDNVARFVAQIQANVRDFERKVKKAQAMATALPDEIETDIDADISKFRRGILQAEALAKRFKSGNVTKRILGDASNFREAIFGAKKSVIDFDKHYQDAQGRWHDNVSGAFVKEFKTIDSVFTRMKRKVSKPIIGKVIMKTFNVKGAYHSVKSNFTDPFNRRMGELADNIRTFGTVFGNMIKGSLIASFSALVPIIAGATSAIMALGNSIGVVAGNLLGFVGALGVAGLGAAAYGGLVASVLARYNDEAFEATEASSAFTRSLDSIKGAWNGIVDQNIDRIFMQMGQAVYGAQFALQGLTPFINDVVESMTRMTNSFKDFMKESPTMLRFYDNMSAKGATVFDSVINGLGQFGKGLVDMVNAGMPLIENVASGFENMGTKFAEWADRMAANDGFKAFTEYVNENMPKISSIFGDAFNGIINLFTAFGENTSTVLDVLVDMMARFREWSETIKESDGFQKFIDYIQTNGPVVLSVIGNIVGAIIGFGIAIAPLAEKVLRLVDSFTEWLDKLMETSPVVGMVVGVITTLFGVMMALAPAFIMITTVLGPIIRGFITLMTNARLVNAVMMLLRVAMVVMSGTVGVVIGVLVALVAVFVMLYQKVEWFRNIVNSVWTFVSTFIQERVALIIETFNQFREQGQGIFEALWNTIVTIISEGLTQTYNSIIQWVASVIAAIVAWGIQLYSTVTSALIQFALTIVAKLLEAKTAFVTWIAETIAAIVTFGINLVTTIITALTTFATTIATKLSEAYNNFVTWITTTIASIVAFGASIISSIVSTMASFVSSIISGTASALSAIVSFIASGISSIISFGANIVSTIVSAMASFVSSIVSGTSSALSAISSFVSSAISSIASFVSSLISNIASGMSSFVSTIASGASSALSTISSFVSSAISSIVSFVSQIVSSITSGMSQFVSAIVSGGASAVSAVVSMGSQIVSSVTGFVGSMVSAGADLIRGLVNGIKSMAGAAVNAAKSVVGDAIAGAKNLLGINSPSRVFRSFGEYTMQGLEIGINRMASRAVGAVTDVARDMTNSFAPDLTTTADIDGQIGNFNRELRSTVDADIQSGIETQRPIVNVTVRNEGDVEMIRSAIQLEDGIDETLAF